MITTKAQFLKAAKRKSRQVDFPGAKDKITLHELTLAQRNQVVEFQRQEKSHIEVLALVVALSASFLDENDVPSLVEKCSDRTIQLLSSVVIDMSGMGSDSDEEAEKNSESGQS
jgi:hypothetical protein